MKILKVTKRFKKDVKKLKNQGKDLDKLKDERFILGVFNYIRPGVVFLCLLVGQHFQVVVQCFHTAVEPFPIMFCLVQ